MLRNSFICVMFALASVFGPMAAAQDTTPAATAPAAVARVMDDYRLGAGDKVRVIVFGEEGLSGEFVVSDSGQISFPLIGDVPAKGASVSEFQDRLTTTLRQGYLKEPRVSIEVLNYRPFYIMGEVRKPGEYPYTSGLTVLNAVATAQGFTYRANMKKVFVRHPGDTKEQEEALTTTTVVGPGDTIRIAERFF